MSKLFSTSRRSLPLAACCAVLALFLPAGCSSGGGSGSSSGGAIYVTISPTTAALNAGDGQPFTAAVPHDTANAGVTWTLSGPGTLSAGTIASVLYTAPSSLSSTASAIITATSITDSSKTASAAITLNPITVTVSPATASLTNGGTQAFSATPNFDSANAGVTWSLTGLGTLTNSTNTSVTYTAPTTISSTTTATLTAASKSDATHFGTATITLNPSAAPASQWVYYNGTSLAYKTLANSDNPSGALGYDQIMDFSTAGYNQGSGALPVASVAANVSPSGDSTGVTDTAAIQAAINTVSAMTLNTTTGFRGAVLLAPGNFYVNNILSIKASGVVLRGSGSGTSGTTNTIINMVAASTPYPLVVLGSYSTSGCSSSTTCSNTSPTMTGSTIAITDAYVPAGATRLDVANVTGLSVGTTIVIQRPVTANWITLMKMNPSDIQPQSQCSSGTCSWISVGNSGLKTDRAITAINGNQITLDSPMSDSIDATYVPGATVQAYTFASRISNVGVENLRAIAPAPANNLVPPTNSYQLVVTYSVLNGWANNISAQDTLQSVDIENYTKQFTVSNVAITHTVTQTGSAQFMEFYISGATQILMDNVSTTADNMYFFSTSSTTQGPNVLRNGNFTGSLHIEPHQRWATGLLIENTTISAGSGGQGNIKLTDRGSYGSGQGWDIGWGVVWNSSAASTIIQAPPGSMNWCIGCKGASATQTAPGGAVVSQGQIDSQGTYVSPYSLYQAQLSQRIPGAIAQ